MDRELVFESGFGTITLLLIVLRWVCMTVFVLAGTLATYGNCVTHPTVHALFICMYVVALVHFWA